MKTAERAEALPLQPVHRDDSGVIRFRKNAIVAFLLDAGPFDMNQIAAMPFSNEDREQFASLIGYSVSGFGDLPYVSDDTFARAEQASGELQRRIAKKRR